MEGQPLDPELCKVGTKLKAIYPPSVEPLSGPPTTGEWVHAAVLDISNPGCEDRPVKVHYKGKKKSEDVWVSLWEVRLTTDTAIDWAEVDRKLPIAQDPDSRTLRQKLFEEWDDNGKGTLSLKELQEGIEYKLTAGGDFGDDIEVIGVAVKRAWDVARKLAPPAKKKKKKAANKSISKQEFHALIVAFRHYLELAELFESMDSSQEDDQKLSYREIKKQLARLEKWGVTDTMLKEQFIDVDVWTPKMKFTDFANLCVSTRWSDKNMDVELDESSDDEVLFEQAAYDMRGKAGISSEAWREGLTESEKRVLDAFQQWDVDGNGKISEGELMTVLGVLDPTITCEKAQRLFAVADLNKDGQLDYEEFCKWLF